METMVPNLECRGHIMNIQWCKEKCFMDNFIADQYEVLKRTSGNQAIETQIDEAMKRGCPNGAELKDKYIREP